MDKSFFTKIKKDVEPVGENILRAVILLFLVIMAGSASAATLTVDDSGGANYTKIQDAIDNASAGDTIIVYSGTYYENVNVNKQLTLRGIGMPVVDAGGSGSAITLAADGITLEGFTATKAAAGILVTSNNNTLIGNNASLNSGYGYGYGYGIYLSSSNNNTLSGNNAISNSGSFAGYGYGIYLSLSSYNTLIGNNATLNTGYGYSYRYSGSGYGISLSSSSNNRIYNNIFNNINNFYFYDSNINTWNSTRQSGTNIIGGPYLSGNFWAYPNGTGFSQKCMDADKDEICDSKYSLDSGNTDYLPLAREAGGKATWTVDDSGGADYSRIQDAIDNASNGDTILVNSGTYYENVDVNKQLILRGNYSVEGVSIVDAGSKGSAIKLSVDGITLIGFTTINSSGLLEAGIKVNSNSNNITNNTFLNNEVGIYFESSNNNTLISNNASTNSGGIYLSSSNNNTLISNNASNSGGIYLFSSSNNTLIGNIASNNYGEGISLFSSSNSNTLSGNIADSNNDIGGIIISGSNNNMLSGNEASNNRYGTIGGGIILGGSDENTLINNTVSNNGIGIGLIGFNNNNKLSNNSVSNNGIGIEIKESSNKNILSNNNISNNQNGMFLIYSSSNNILNGNTVSSNYESGIYLEYLSNDNTLISNNVLNNIYGIWLVTSSNNIIYNNYFNNTINALDDGNNIWNISKTAETNIISGPYLGGNYWFDYAGTDINDDGMGDTLVPYNSSGNIANYGDFLPLTIIPTLTASSISGYKINDTNGNGKWDAGEAGIQGWNITLKNTTTGAVITSNLTDANGFYQFLNLVNGSYNATEEMRTGFNPTNATFNLVTIAGLNVMNLNFTNQPMKESVGKIMNPGFENGTASWTFYTNGTGTFSIISPGYEGINAARVALKTNGTNIQLYQKGIMLEPNTRYRLSFAAYSTSGHDLEVNLIQHGSPYTNYGLAYKANLSKSWQTFTTEFTSSGFKGTVNDGRLMFWMTPFAASGDTYYIDNVQLEKV